MAEPWSMFGDRVQLQQVLINLAINGMDAMATAPEPERHLTIRTRTRRTDQVDVVVVDHGSGIRLT
jgi:C4-dicarboxylate-specific signal transduction histidine kinase